MQGKLFFIDGPGGTGKTFLYDLLLARVRSQGEVALAVASSGLAALLLAGGTLSVPHSHSSRGRHPLQVSMILHNSAYHITDCGYHISVNATIF